MGTSEHNDASCCPRCRTDAQFLGDGYDGESNWYLCPTCRYAWQRKVGAAPAAQRPEPPMTAPRYRATA